MHEERTPNGPLGGAPEARAAPWRLRWFDAPQVDGFYLAMMRRRLMGQWLRSRPTAVGASTRYAVVCVYRSALLGPMRPN